MRRAVVAGIAAVIAGGLGAAATSGNVLPSSTAGYTSVTVTGASMKSISYTVTANTITAFTVNLKGPATTTMLVNGVPVTMTLFSTVRAHFGAAADVACTLGTYDATNDSTPASCSPFAQVASSSWALTITVS